MYVSVSGGEWIQMSNDDTSQAVMMVVALVTKKSLASFVLITVGKL